VKAPCAFVILADDFSALRAEVWTCFLNQLRRDNVEGLMQDLKSLLYFIGYSLINTGTVFGGQAIVVPEKIKSKTGFIK
jgi:hypothetical protein